jgi:hypothetical protein
MSRNPNAIYLTEGEAVTYTFTVKRDGTAVDLSSATVTFYVHDNDPDVAFGTNKIDNSATGWVTDGSDGKFTYTFTVANSTFATDRDFEGVYAAKIVEGSVLEWTKQEPIYIVRNPFQVEGS